MSITGQFSQYLAVAPPGCILDSVIWNFGEFTTQLYSQYAPNEAEALPVPLENFTGNPISFYYAGEGNFVYTQTITYTTAEGGSLTEEVSGEDFFEAPEVDVDEIAGAADWDIVQDPSGRWFLALGNAAEAEGFEFLCDVVLPEKEAASGLLGFCQLVGVTLTYTTFQGQDLQLNQPMLLLDNNFPYTEPAAAIPGEPIPITCVDSPSYWLPDDNCSRVEVSLSFETGVIYQPAGGIWVQLGTVSWAAEAIATRPDEQAPWLLLPGSATQFGDWTPSVSLPTWTANIAVPGDAFEAQVTAEFGPPPPPPEEL